MATLFTFSIMTLVMVVCTESQFALNLTQVAYNSSENVSLTILHETDKNYNKSHPLSIHNLNITDKHQGYGDDVKETATTNKSLAVRLDKDNTFNSSTEHLVSTSDKSVSAAQSGVSQSAAESQSELQHNTTEVPFKPPVTAVKQSPSRFQSVPGESQEPINVTKGESDMAAINGTTQYVTQSTATTQHVKQSVSPAVNLTVNPNDSSNHYEETSELNKETTNAPTTENIVPLVISRQNDTSGENATSSGTSRETLGDTQMSFPGTSKHVLEDAVAKGNGDNASSVIFANASTAPNEYIGFNSNQSADMPSNDKLQINTDNGNMKPNNSTTTYAMEHNTSSKNINGTQTVTVRISDSVITEPNTLSTPANNNNTIRNSNSSMPITPLNGETSSFTSNSAIENSPATAKNDGEERGDGTVDYLFHYPTALPKPPHLKELHEHGYSGPHAQHGLVWEDHDYLVRVLFPVGCGIVGAVAIVTVMYGCSTSKSCRNAEPCCCNHPQDHDKVLLLDISSDDEEEKEEEEAVKQI